MSATGGTQDFDLCTNQLQSGGELSFHESGIQPEDGVAKAMKHAVTTRVSGRS